MIIGDKNSEHYKKITHDKWKVAAPEISLEQALKCEDILLEYVNGKKQQEEVLHEINSFLETNGLIKIKK